VTVGHVADVRADQCEQPITLCAVERRRGNASRLDRDVVTEHLGHVVAAAFSGIENRRGALPGVERLHEGERELLLGREQRRARIFARLGRDRLRSHERRRHHDLVAEHEIIDDRMMAVDLPPPRLGRRRRPHDREPIEMLAVLVEARDELGEMMVEPHDVARRRIASRTEPGAEQLVGSRALRIAHFMETHALAWEAVHVRPVSPFVVVERIAEACALLVAHRSDQTFGRAADRLRRQAGRTDREQALLGSAVGRESHERLGERRARAVRERARSAGRLTQCEPAEQHAEQSGGGKRA
jgi:hypothetical protein